MTAARTLRFASIVLPPGVGPAPSRDPSPQLRHEQGLAAIAAYARRLEDAGFSALILGDDGFATSDRFGPPARTTQAVSFEPLTLASALAALTERIGLVPTTTDVNEPFHVARRLATLDHISGGRAGWNINANAVWKAPGGFARGAHAAHPDSDELADEFLAVVRGLWDSYADDALVADKSSGLYFRPGGRRPLDHAGTHFQVAGPLNLSRSPQGHPVIFHTIGNPAARAFADRSADVVLTEDRSIDAALATRARLADSLRAARTGPMNVQMWPRITPVVASTEAEATTLRDELRASPLGDAADASAAFLIGTPEQVADRISAWHQAGAADGFAVSLPSSPADADPFLNEVLPLLARRGRFAPTEGATLRDVLGLSRPERNAR
ncbi:LLM class flavin-dependent oxidoreductase [Microbacterium sp. No. 7]|uniref:LLM class flavin-dependent oxidoreductase n=1 Tax=Microbacterium sp. No. 7 TaxID=1714373 RepID=UPI0006CF2950|nr:LLM class flavin-dependent oxidoreductase [Microbacterium sp. No. 7]